MTSDSSSGFPSSGVSPTSGGQTLCDLLQAGRIAVLSDQPALAIRHLMAAFDLATSNSELDAQVIVLSDLAVVYRELGEFDLARRFQQRVVNLQSSSDSADLEALANDAFSCGEFDLAKELISTAIAIEEAATPVERANTVGTRGLIAAANRRPKTGLRLLYQASQLHQQQKDRLGAGKDWLNMAEVFSQLGRYRGMRSALRRAIRCLAQTPSTYWLPIARLRYSQIDKAFQRAKSAISSN
jgi:tetratricopeptide (TPR) repeat protein